MKLAKVMLLHGISVTNVMIRQDAKRLKGIKADSLRRDSQLWV